MPTANPLRAQEAAVKWHAKGYSVAFFLDQEDKQEYGPREFTYHGKYGGVWDATNKLACTAVGSFRYSVCVFAGDDMDPEPNYVASEIEAQYRERFPDGYGVMQPCGDPQGRDASGKSAAARICGSAWFGKAWIEQAYEGKGPTNATYWHFYADEELARVAEQQGVMWWRPDLTQYHRHWSFGHSRITPYQERNQKHWEMDRSIFMERLKLEFPGSGRKRT